MAVSGAGPAVGGSGLPGRARYWAAPALLLAAWSCVACGGVARSSCAAAFPGGQREFMFVAEQGDAAVGEYAVNACGKLTSRGAAKATGAPVALVVTPDGRFAYAVDEKGRVDEYRVSAAGSLEALQPPSVATAAGALAAALSPSGLYLYVADSTAGRISVFGRDPASGALTPLPQASVATGASSTPWSLALSPSGRYLYVVERAANRIAVFPVDPATGRPSVRASASVTSDGIYPRSIALAPTGRYAYVVNESDTVAEFAVAPSGGGLRAIPGSPLTLAGEIPWQVIVAPSDQFAYVVNQGGFIMEYEVNTTAGQMESEGFTTGPGGLLPLPGSPSPAGTSPSAMALDPSGRFVYALEAYTDQILAFRVSGSGLLTQIGGPVACGSDPSAVAFVALPGG